jgi:hypothetical protein
MGVGLMKHVKNNIYLVNNIAGFRKAFGHFAGREVPPNCYKQLDKPVVYPSVIWFVWQGSGVLKCSPLSLVELNSVISQQETV